MGFRLVEVDTIKKYVQRRTHRKRRINKKWLKRYGYKEVTNDGKISVFGGCIFATPKTIEVILSTVRGGNDE
jgi:hypothetical protein